MMTNKNDLGIYVHIPFCKKKCNYCAFISAPSTDDVINKYFKKLKEEIILSAPINSEKIVKTIYFGGGTPSCVNARHITETLNTIFNNYKICKKPEITIECNPSSTNFEKLQIFKNAGFNRLSVGVQTINKDALKVLGRDNKNKQFKVLSMARKAGFRNISCDIMLGIPHQTQKDINSLALKLIKHKITHISCYMLILEENTPLSKMVEQGEIALPSEDEVAKQYQNLVKYLSKKGFKQYEVASFAKCGKVSKHNLSYWQNKSYLGFGLSAHSYSAENHTRTANVTNLNDYINGKVIQTEEMLNTRQQIEERIMLSLRTKFALNTRQLKTELGYDILTKKQPEIEMLQKSGFIIIKNNKLIVPRKHYNVLNSIILKLV